MYDYLVVGAGLAGATFAEHAGRAGKSCLVIDRRPHIAGNCYTEDMGGIDVHKYGPHLFHTNNRAIWKYVTSFTEFNTYRHTVRGVLIDGSEVSLPINLQTFNTLFGYRTPQEAIEYLERNRQEGVDPSSIKGWCLGTIGLELYELLIEQYTRRQWNKDPKNLPASIIRRLPVRTEYNTDYFTDAYQGVPIHGYTNLVRNMLRHVDIITSCDFHKNPEVRKLAKKIVYTGSCDELFGYALGRLEYRSIRMEHTVRNQEYVQSVGQLNNLTAYGEYTRTVEWKHFNPVERPYTVVSKEFPVAVGEPYYPVNDEQNNALAARYAELAQREGYILIGRMANYQYYDMHQVIGQAISVARKELHGY